MIKKKYVPDGKYDWSLELYEKYKRVDDDIDHSSISSCDITPNERIGMNEDETIQKANINQLVKRYSTIKHTNEPKMKSVRNNM